MLWTVDNGDAEYDEFCAEARVLDSTLNARLSDLLGGDNDRVNRLLATINEHQRSVLRPSFQDRSGVIAHPLTSNIVETPIYQRAPTSSSHVAPVTDENIEFFEDSRSSAIEDVNSGPSVLTASGDSVPWSNLWNDNTLGSQLSEISDSSAAVRLPQAGGNKTSSNSQGTEEVDK